MATKLANLKPALDKLKPTDKGTKLTANGQQLEDLTAKALATATTATNGEKHDESGAGFKLTTTDAGTQAELKAALNALGEPLKAAKLTANAEQLTDALTAENAQNLKNLADAGTQATLGSRLKLKS